MTFLRILLVGIIVIVFFVLSHLFSTLDKDLEFSRKKVAELELQRKQEVVIPQEEIICLGGLEYIKKNDRLVQLFVLVDETVIQSRCGDIPKNEGLTDEEANIPDINGKQPRTESDSPVKTAKNSKKQAKKAGGKKNAE